MDRAPPVGGGPLNGASAASAATAANRPILAADPAGRRVFLKSGAMRVLVQRVSSVWVRFADGSETRRSGLGLLALVGFAEGDSEALLEPMARKLLQMRIFDDGEGRMNRALAEAGGDLTLVPQFTLYADLRKGRRPSFARALAPGLARELFERFAALCREAVPSVATGRFGEPMAVNLINDGPVTILLDSDELNLTATPPASRRA